MEKTLIKAKEALNNHGVIAFPTETVMGLAVYYDDRTAYDKLNRIKRRPEDKPYTMMVKDIYQIDKYAIIDERIKKVIKAFMPGPITLLLSAKDDLPSWVTHNSGVIGIRIPENEIGLALLKVLDKPILVPSANRSGEKPAINSKEVEVIFHNEVDFIISGEAGLAKPSTIISMLNNEMKVVREGPIKKEEIERIYKNL